MTHNDLMNLNLYERSNCITFLGAKTKYNIEKYKYPFPLNQLTAITYRVRNDIKSAIEEILRLEIQKQPKETHTKKELENMLYEDLRNIRKNLRKIKVVQMEMALPETTKKAKEIITNETNDFMEPFNMDVIFITQEEGKAMFGDEFEQYSKEELLQMGYKVEFGYNTFDKEQDKQKLKDSIRDKLIVFINQLDPNYTMEELYLCSLENLRKIYEELTASYETLPTYEDITLSVKMGL